MTNKEIPNEPGKNRPLMLSDKLGYPTSVGDEDWEKKHKQYYTQLPNGNWVKKK
jgi:hypothetical protein